MKTRDRSSTYSDFFGLLLFVGDQFCQALFELVRSVRYLFLHQRLLLTVAVQQRDLLE